MSNTRGSGDDGSAVPVGLAIAEPTVPLSEDTTWEVMADASSSVGEAGRTRGDEDEALLRDARAAAAAGDRRRADALECALALGYDRQGRTDEVLAAWRNVFEHDPSLLIAYWGLRRSLEGRGAWDELLGVFERRISAMSPADPAGGDTGAGQSSAPGDTRESGRAELWLCHGRVLEDRLGRDAAAARSYRTGLIESPGHVGLLLSLALLGWRRADDGMIAEALTGFLRSPLPPAARAAMTAAVARIERSPGGSGGASGGRASAIDAVSAARALETLRGALGAVGAAEAAPLVSELWTLARATADPRARVEILEELVNHLPPERGDVIVGLLRERARLMRDQLGDKVASAETLRRALTLSPRNPMVLTELADLIEEASGDGGVDGLARASEGLAALLAVVVAPSGQPLRSGAERELALRYLVALGRQGRAADGLAFLDLHPEVQDGRPDVAAIDVFLRTMSGDAVGLAAAFERVDTRHAEGGAGSADGPRSAGDAQIIAGVLRERAAPDAAGETLSVVSYKKAVALDPGSEVAAEALERRLRASRSWEALAEHWQGRLGDAGLSASTDGRPTDDPMRFRLLEELVALERDELADPVAARRFQDELCRRADHPRANLRRLDLELLTGAGLSAGPTAAICDSLRALGEQAGTSDAQAAFYVEAGLALAARGERGESEELLRAALSTDTTGRAASGLERLLSNNPSGSAASLRAEIVRTELVPRRTRDASVARALRFRLAHHLASAGRDAEALEVLDELRAAGDEMAGAFGWEIARQSARPDLARDFLEGSEGSGAFTDARSRDLRVDSDLGEILEAAEDLPAAATAYREALLRQPTADAALGLFRIGARLGDSAVLGEATRALAPFADEETRVQAWRDLEMLDSVARPHEPHGRGTEPQAPAANTAEDESTAVLAWATAMERGDVVSTSAALLALARVTSAASDRQQRSGLLARAAARSRLGGAALAGAVHDQVHALSDGGAALALGLSDLPVAGRPERAAARVARAARSGARLAYALDIERAVDAETRGDSATALEAYRRATEREPSGIEGLDGTRRVCLATGNRLGAARAGMRLGSVLKTPRRAAEELGRAATLLREEGLRGEAKSAAWQALAREPGSEALFELLRGVLADDADHAGLDRLLGLRLAVVEDQRARVPLWLDRALNRLEHLGHRDLAVQDFKRILKAAPDHDRALRILATLATSSQAFAPAIGYLSRLRDLESDGVRWRDLTFELAEAHEAAGEGAQARAALEEAVLRRPDDDLPRQHLVELMLRTDDWRAARAALEAWSGVRPARKAAALWLRIGEIERDQGRSRAAAAAAFSRAADLDPLGEGLLALADLHARFGDLAARQSVLDDGIAEARRALAQSPCDVARLRHLRGLYVARVADAPAHDASAELAGHGVSVVDQVLGLLGASEGGAAAELPALRIPVLRGVLPAALPDQPGAAGVRGFAAEVWGKIARVATEMFDAAKIKPPARERVGAGAEPRLAWIEAAAAAMGLPALELLLSKRQEASDDTVVAIDAGAPALAVGRAALAGDAAIRFKVGRALSLLRDRAVMFEERSAGEVATLFAAAAAASGAGTAVSTGTLPGVDGLADVAAYGKNMLRLMSRREKKSLELEASRFGFEPVDGAGFQAAVLETADRVGLLLAGDVATSVRVACGGTAASPQALATDGRALALLRYALGEAYLTLRRELAEEGGD